jgi:hypothetical protein
MAGEAVRGALVLAPEPAGPAVQAAVGTTVAIATPSARAGAEVSRRASERAQRVLDATKSENTEVNRPSARPGYAEGPGFA